MNGEQFVRALVDLSVQSNAVWEQRYASEIVHAIESTYNREILRDMYIYDIATTPKGDFVIQWKKRMFQLTPQEVNDRYGNQDTI